MGEQQREEIRLSFYPIEKVTDLFLTFLILKSDEMKRMGLLGIVAVMLLTIVGTVMAVGNGRSGYNWKANIFVGTGLQWCMEKFGWSEEVCRNYLGVYADDKLTMKWNEEWNRGNEEGWSSPPYDAYLNNEWNGMFPGGSGSVWHYNIKWIGTCGADYTPLPDGGYCIWGQFEVLMDQGIDPSYGPGHLWFAHAIPTGYGA